MAPKWPVDPHADPYHGDLEPIPAGSVPDLDNSYIGNTLLQSVVNPKGTEAAGMAARPVPLQHIDTFEQGYDALMPAQDDVAVNHRTIWENIAKALKQAQEEFARDIAAQMTGFGGDTAKNMFGKATASLDYLASLSSASDRMNVLVDTFSRDMSETKHWFVSNYDKLTKEDVPNATWGKPEKDWPAIIDGLLQQYNREAQHVIREFYNPPIDRISKSHPDMSPSPPQMAGQPPVAAPSGGSPPGGLRSGGLGTPQMPSLPGPGALGPTDPATGQPASPTMPANALQGIGDAAKGAGDAANSAGQQAQNAAGQAGNAANQALGQIPKGGQTGPAALPEGVLGLGPKGLKSPTTAGSGGGRGGGSGGAAARGPAGMATGQATPASKAATSVQASRASVSPGAGGAGAGAPVAGQRGAAGADKEHKASKALRNAKHGQEVIGETDAVVAVLGDEANESNPPS